ncbi:uncharacterized protein LOC126316809 [Schistocerca gregaria]|uniref:uncharacterized protein LOC126316809 n=1 Tax=Schistocerca gregaria TaxID=7010 RepID=UPI00211DB5A7|nr:uncharacterized protein LOC126316809 [Schistocerca gregaria]
MQYLHPIDHAIQTINFRLSEKIKESSRCEYVTYQIAVLLCAFASFHKKSFIELSFVSLLGFFANMLSTDLGIAVLPVPFLFSNFGQYDLFFGSILQSAISAVILSWSIQKKTWLSKLPGLPSWTLAIAIVLNTWIHMLGRLQYSDGPAVSLANLAMILIQYTLCLSFMSRESGSSFKVNELIISTELIIAGYTWCISTFNHWTDALIYEQFACLFFFASWVLIWSLHIDFSRHHTQIRHVIILLCQCVTMLICVPSKKFQVSYDMESTVLAKMFLTGYQLVVSEFVDWWLVKYYVAISIVFVLSATCFVYLNLHKSVNRSIQRKSFHFLALLLFVPGMLRCPYFLKFGFMIALILFNLEEHMRWKNFIYGRPRQIIDSFLLHVINSQTEVGPILTSHTYLLLGCGVSLLINRDLERVPYEDMLGPLLLLGIGDSFSSIVGQKLGRHRWPKTNKTVEGTISGIASTFVGFYALAWYKGLALQCVYKFFVATVFSFLIEAFTEGIDNLVLPIMFECIYKSNLLC